MLIYDCNNLKVLKKCMNSSSSSSINVCSYIFLQEPCFGVFVNVPV